MGVERFFSSINRDFNITIDTNYPYKKVKCKYLMIDFNSIVHIISQHMINTIIENILKISQVKYTMDSKISPGINQDQD